MTAGTSIARAHRAVHWWIGDWLLFAQRHDGDPRYEQALNDFGFEFSTLQNDRWVAERIEQDRRRPELSWGHHAEVAALEPDEQERWLDKAAQSDWTRSLLRQALRDRRLARRRADAVMERPAAEGLPDIPVRATPVLHGTLKAVSERLPVNCFGLILCDPPATNDPSTLFTGLAWSAERLLRPGGSILVAAGQIDIGVAWVALESVLMPYWAIAFPMMTGPARPFVQSLWRCVLWFSKGGPPLDIREVRDTAEADPWPYLTEQLTRAGDQVFVPYCGEGEIVEAVLRAGRGPVATDPDEDHCAAARVRLGLAE